MLPLILQLQSLKSNCFIRISSFRYFISYKHFDFNPNKSEQHIFLFITLGQVLSNNNFVIMSSTTSFLKSHRVEISYFWKIKVVISSGGGVILISILGVKLAKWPFSFKLVKLQVRKFKTHRNWEKNHREDV